MNKNIKILIVVGILVVLSIAFISFSSKKENGSTKKQENVVKIENVARDTDFNPEDISPSELVNKLDKLDEMSNEIEKTN